MWVLVEPYVRIYGHTSLSLILSFDGLEKKGCRVISVVSLMFFFRWLPGHPSKEY